MKYLLIFFLALSTGIASGQVVTTIGRSDDPFQKNLYSADRVMDLRNKLELTEAQATKIKKLHSENAGKFSTMKWDLDDATAKLKELLDESKIDEQAAQKQMDKVLALENSLKKQQLSTMISIKNELSPEQQKILQQNNVYSLSSVKAVGYGVNSTSPVKIVTGSASNYRVGQPLTVATSTNSSSSPKLALQIAGYGQENVPIFMLEDEDGMKQLKDIKNINPNDIESIEVLKDKSAIDTFGEKGKNGVIIIKLKKDSKK